VPPSGLRSNGIPAIEQTSRGSVNCDLERISRDSRSAERAEPWFALRVRSNFEQISGLHLRQRGFEEYLPVYRVQNRWSDRTKAVERPLFPGYVFCRMNPHNRLPVLSAPGILGVLGIGKIPVPVPDQEIEAIRIMLASGLRVKPWPFLQAGQRVLIERGPLEGLEGILLRFKNDCRIVVSIDLLQRSVSSELDEHWVRPVGQRAPGRVGAIDPGFATQLHLRSAG
jgi:transcription antitermination factor NusG